MSVRVVLADDQDLVRTGVRMILEAEDDFEIVGEARDGGEAVAKCRRLRPDVVVMDIRMPVLDGVEATRQLTALDPPLPTRVLMLTTYDLDEYVFAALRAGAAGFLLKHAPSEELVAGIRTVAAGDSGAWLELGMLLARHGARADAEHALREAAVGGDGMAWNNLGWLLVDDPGREREAEAALRSAIAAGYEPARVNLGWLLARQPGREREAEAVYRDAIAVAASSDGKSGATGIASAWSNLGLLLSEAGREDDAEAVYRDAIATGDSSAWLDLGALAERRGRNAEAEAAYREAIAAGHADAALSLGVLLSRQRRRGPEVEQAYRLAMEGSEANVASLAALRLASLLERRRDRAAARACYEFVIERGSDKTVERAALKLAALLVEQNDRSGARAFLNVAAEAALREAGKQNEVDDRRTSAPPPVAPVEAASAQARSTHGPLRRLRVALLRVRR
ncbi:MAG: response regulator [Actinobacteria bacterium]|nr:response regulator [Actinomycetota bacterium]